MLYLVEVQASMEKANEIDRSGGPGEFFAKINDRFAPKAMWGEPTDRRVFLIVELESAAAIAELMFAFTWFSHAQPRFVPLMAPEVYGEAIENARKIVSP